MGIAHSDEASKERQSLLDSSVRPEESSLMSDPHVSYSASEILKSYAHHLWILLVLSILILFQIIFFYKDTDFNQKLLTNLTYFATLVLSFSGCGLIAVCLCYRWRKQILKRLVNLMRDVSRFGNSDQKIIILMRELKIWWRLGFWAALREFGDLFPWLASLSFVGHVSTMDLAALSLVEVFIYTLMDLTWWAVSMTESVLVSQAHGCRCLLTMRGWALMSFIVITVCNLSLTIMCLACRTMLIAFGFDALIAERGATYAMFIIPTFYAEGVTIVTATYLTAFQEASLPAYIQLISGVVHLVVTYILIFGIGEFEGMDDALKAAALGWIISSCLSCFLDASAMNQLWGKELNYIAEEHTYQGENYQNQENEISHLIPKPNASETAQNNNGNVPENVPSNRPLEILKKQPNGLPFMGSLLPQEFAMNEKNSTLHVSFAQTFEWVCDRNRWWKYSEQALPNFATTGMQSLSMFVMALLAAKMGRYEIAAHNSSVALFEVLYTVVQGMGEGTSIRIGYLVGKGDIQSAKVVMWISFTAGLCWGIFVAGAGYLFRYDIAAFLSNDPEVQSISVELAPLVWGSYAVFSVGGQCFSVLDGQARAPAQAVSFLVGSWLISVPLFMFSSLWMECGLEGLWYSLIIGYIGTLAVAANRIHASDWDKIVHRAKERIADEKAQS